MNFRKNHNLLARIEENTEILSIRTKTRTQESLELVLILTKFLDTFPLNAPLELSDEKYMIAVTNLDVYNSVLRKTS